MSTPRTSINYDVVHIRRSEGKKYVTLQQLTRLIVH
jgi:hypothetical protein